MSTKITDGNREQLFRRVAFGAALGRSIARGRATKQLLNNCLNMLNGAALAMVTTFYFRGDAYAWLWLATLVTVNVSREVYLYREAVTDTLTDGIWEHVLLAHCVAALRELNPAVAARLFREPTLRKSQELVDEIVEKQAIVNQREAEAATQNSRPAARAEERNQSPGS